MLQVAMAATAYAKHARTWDGRGGTQLAARDPCVLESQERSMLEKDWGSRRRLGKQMNGARHPRPRQDSPLVVWVAQEGDPQTQAWAEQRRPQMTVQRKPLAGISSMYVSLAGSLLVHAILQES